MTEFEFHATPAAEPPVFTPVPPQGPPGPKTGKATRYVLDGLEATVLAWLGGAALNEGWHVHLPFAPTWILALCLAYGLEFGAGVVSGAWHEAKAHHAAAIRTAEKMAELMAEKYGPAVLESAARQLGIPQ